MKSKLALFVSGIALLGGLALHAQQQKAAVPAPATTDPYIWLEDITGDKAMAWVHARNAESAKELESGETFTTLQADILKILDSDARIPYVSKSGAYYYNFWRDAKNPRGLWRRTTLEEYRKPSPKWETVLDVDALGAAEKESWVFKGAQFLQAGLSPVPDFAVARRRRCERHARVRRRSQVVRQGRIPAARGQEPVELG